MVWVNAKWYKEKEAWFDQKQPELRASAKKFQNAQGTHVRLNSVSSTFSASVFGISNSTPLSLSFKHVSFWVQDNRHELSLYDRYVKKVEPKELQILRDIQGYFEAGKLTAVMVMRLAEWKFRCECNLYLRALQVNKVQRTEFLQTIQEMFD